MPDYRESPIRPRGCITLGPDSPTDEVHALKDRSNKGKPVPHVQNGVVHVQFPAHEDLNWAKPLLRTERHFAAIFVDSWTAGDLEALPRVIAFCANVRNEMERLGRRMLSSTVTVSVAEVSQGPDQRKAIREIQRRGFGAVRDSFDHYIDKHFNKAG